VTLWVKNVILDVVTDVRYSPDTDRDCDLPGGRQVPLSDIETLAFSLPIAAA
jgi:hypothetical protein